MKKYKRTALTEMKWSHPMSIKELSQIFNVNRNTMSKWLKEQVICNRQMSTRKWEIAEFELPKNSYKKISRTN